MPRAHSTPSAANYTAGRANIVVDGHMAQGYEAYAAETCSKASRQPASARRPARAHGYMYERHRVEVTRATLRVSGLPPSPRRHAHRLPHRHPPQQTVPHELIAARRRAADGGSAGPDRARRRLRYLRETVTSSGRRRSPAPDCRRRTACSPCSAITTTTTTCRRPSRPRRRPCSRDARTQLTIRGERGRLVGIRFWTRRVARHRPLLRGAPPERGAARAHPDAGSPKPRRLVPLVLSGHTHGGQVVLPGLGRRRRTRVSGDRRAGAATNTTIFVSRGVGTV